jgi:hypothetical protein
MREDLLQIDTSPIEQLVRIKEEESVLQERLQKMDDNRDNVSAVVYQRVRRDYEQRLASLESEALPLKNHARKEYGKLRTLQIGMERALEDSRLEKEELEFRNSLGEFVKSEFTQHLAEIDAKLAARQGDLDDAIQLKARFLTAFHSEEDLNSDVQPTEPRPADPISQPPTTPPPPSAQFAEPKPDDATALAFRSESSHPHPPEQRDTHHPPAPADATAIAWFGEEHAYAAPHHQEAFSSPSTMQGAGATEPGSAPLMDASFPPFTPAADATQVAPIASLSAGLGAPPRIVALVGDGQGQEWVLPPGLTSLGRSPKAQIRIIEESVSRQHAQLIVGPDGCKIVDMGSENGTNVNGRRVTEQFLNDGDLIQIGSHRFVFRQAG